LESVLLPAQKEKVEKHLLNQFMLNSGLDLTSCPCGNIMEVSAGEPDYNSKDDKG